MKKIFSSIFRKWSLPPFFILKFALSLFASFHLAFFLASVFYITALRDSNPRATAYMLYRNGYKSTGVPVPGFIPLGKIPLDFVRCSVYIEDLDFYRHFGFDMESIALALRVNKKLGYMAYGGSTITQQLARNLFLSPKKNYMRKYMELLLALELDFLLTKERILELYLNYAEWGERVYGIADGARYHYGKSVNELSGEEKLKLLAVLPSPLNYSTTGFTENPMLTARYRSLENYYEIIKNEPPRFKSTIRVLN